MTCFFYLTRFNFFLTPPKFQTLEELFSTPDRVQNPVRGKESF